MAPLRQRSFIILDDDDVNDDLAVLDHVSSGSISSSRIVKPATRSTTMSGVKAVPVQPTSGSQDILLTSRSPNASITSPFGGSDWSSKPTRSGAMAPTSPDLLGQASRVSLVRAVPEYRAISRTLSLSPTAEALRASMLGSAHDPIDLLAEDSGDDIGGDMSRDTKRTRSEDKTSHCPMPRHGADQNRQYIFLDNDDEDGDEPPNALVRSLRRHPTAEDELIDLENIEDVLLQADGQLLQLEGVYLDEAKSQDSRRSSRAVKIERRNPDIVFPFVRKESLKHLGSTILPNKTVELRDGSFMRITDVLLNTQTNAVTLRGHRLQRTRDMNGMLEKKMNECLLFLEIDDDDHRDPLKQAVFETPLAEVVQLRNVRYTNEIFPLNRNLDLTDFNSKKMVQETGGLTARWKYTCHYVSAIGRHNNYKERSLERLEPDECTKGYATLKAARRFKWRGETVLGGAYQPTVDRKETIVLLESRGEENTTSIASSPKAKNSALAQVYSIDDSSSDEEDRSNCASEKRLRINVAKRKHSEMAVDFSEQTSWCGQSQKKLKQAEEKALKETRERLSRMSLQPCQEKELGINLKPIDLSPRLSMSIDLTSSDLAAPPVTGSLGTAPGAPRRRTVRTAGQKLTYGDAFCGAGGATRGATMAGLRALWGFDHWEHACETWRANFPYATCYHEDAHGFVQFAKRFPHLVKVDILHLSPPCQFFSPAHTINGCDDEMNTASLFAVLDVIRVSKPRIVTLEQTFGICHPRFRFYFNALVHMFTAQDFSIRWAIIPLAQWGLPARRMRLIMIAACPGEILPRMPAATHSEFGGATLKPFTSVQSVLSSIPRPNVLRPDPLHDPVPFPLNKYFTPWDASGILPRAITTSGGGNWHPSGKRDFTKREYAALQGFPQCHLFKGKAIKKQIGNAVPPCIAKVLFESIKRDLDAADGVEDDPELIE